MRIVFGSLAIAMSLSKRTEFCLSEWINVLLAAVPLRSRTSFLELLCGCMISPEGWVSRAIPAIGCTRHWTAYFKLLERGTWRTVPLARALLRLVLAVLPSGTLTMVLDDTLIMRCSKRAPGVAWRREHSGKTNRPKHVWAQCIVTLEVSVLGNGGVGMVLPILSRLVPETGNTNKLKIALALVRGAQFNDCSLLHRWRFRNAASCSADNAFSDFRVQLFDLGGEGAPTRIAQRPQGRSSTTAMAQIVIDGRLLLYFRIPRPRTNIAST